MILKYAFVFFVEEKRNYLWKLGLCTLLIVQVCRF